MENLPTPGLEFLRVIGRLVNVVHQQQPALLPACRWLLLGPGLSRLVAPETVPSVNDLRALLRLLQNEAPSLFEVAEQFATLSERGEAARLELRVDRLIEHDDWHHPTQVLDRPRPALDMLLEACRARLEHTREEDRHRVESAVAKIERAVRIADEARTKRERLHGRRSLLSENSEN